MIILENEKYICRYHYDGSNEEFEMESSSRRYLQGKMCELAMEKGVSYKIYAVIEEGYNEPLNYND